MLMHRHLLRSAAAGRRLRWAVTSSSSPQQYAHCHRWQRLYSTTAPALQSDAAVEDGEGGDEPPPPPAGGLPKADPRRAAQQFNVRRAAYKNAVSEMRKRYAAEIERQRLSDEAEETRRRAALTRRRLERQRAKNIRSSKNAAREEERRLRRAAEFEEELRVAQINRDARNARFAKARQMVVDELEAEALLWMTTPEEVEAALDLEAEQKLWARRGGVVGAPAPTDDAEFWRFECHTWDMSKTYRTPREILLEDLDEMSYAEANVNEEYWNAERLLHAYETEEKARLRAMVREEGRKALLARQRRMMQDQYAGERQASEGSGGDEGRAAIPHAMPAPKLDVLANYAAMEREGVKVLEEHPEKFFRFEQEGAAAAAGDDDDALAAADGVPASSADGSSNLGRALGLRDPVREDPSGLIRGSPYPDIIGRDPSPDTRTEREKKRDEREERMWAAAQEAKDAEKAADKSIEYAAEETLDDGSDPIVYDDIGNAGDEDDRGWEEGIDPGVEGDLLATPRAQRYTEEDFEWVIEQLSGKVDKLKEVLQFEEESAMQEMRAKMETEGRDAGAGETEGEGEGETDEVAKALGEGARKSEGVDERGRKFVQYDLDSDDDRLFQSDLFKSDELEALGVDVSEIDALLGTFTPEQLEAYESLGVDDGEIMSAEEISDALRKVPGLSEEQVQTMVELETSLVKNEKFIEAYKEKLIKEVRNTEMLEEAYKDIEKLLSKGDDGKE